MNRDFMSVFRDVAIAWAMIIWAGSLLSGPTPVDPVKQGRNDAKRDIAYDSIMSEWISDCDCTSNLDK